MLELMPARRTEEPRRFQSTVPYYARFRLGYPDLLIRRVVALTRLTPGDRVLDLGCGPGLLALPFARAGMTVTAVDPEPDMAAAARKAAKQARLEIDIRMGSSFDLPAGIGPFTLVSMGRSFHWMDRIETLKALDKLVVADGAVALFDDKHPKTVENGWRAVLDQVASRYGADQAPHRVARKSADYRNHESILLDSAFPALESVGVVVRRELSTDDIVGYAWSLSVTARQALSERTSAFETELRAELAKLSAEGRFVEIAEMRALVATRSQRGAGHRR
jgi:ubiquinone/menaquinone biosynthesis C-methylase UbiE